MSAGSLDRLEPALLWHWFLEVCSVPRESGAEERMSDFLERFASDRALECLRDRVGNVLIRKPASGSRSASVALQAHTDMVAESLPGIGHDFSRDPIVPFVEEGSWVTARGTTLGADNGMGVAAMLTLLDSEGITHPPLECLFTVDEERGMVGARQLDPSWLCSRRLINLDSESDTTFFIGCAGGHDTTITASFESCPIPSGLLLREVSVEGLRGGHSGVAIDREGANAICLLSRALSGLPETMGLHLVGMGNPGRSNVIPVSASAAVALPERVLPKLEAFLLRKLEEFRTEYRNADDGILMTCRDREAQAGSCLTYSGTRRALDLLLAVPHGVTRMSSVTPGLVETSTNLSGVVLEGPVLTIFTSQRSSLDPAREDLYARLAAIARLAGGSAEISMEYPGWNPDPGAGLVRLAVSTFEELFGIEPTLLSVHAGLECGMFARKVPGLEMLSIGPEIRRVHTPEERLSIGSTQRFWRLLLRLLERV
ncbi:beta-Ala-His dipeptidase [Candidatus Fermentibacterales bacterium]|nr:beta-Ala-His dipeptidase [Candidatus Fermentibacterales bacterium]